MSTINNSRDVCQAFQRNLWSHACNYPYHVHMTSGALAEELATFAKHKEELLGVAEGQYALIHGSEVLGTYDTETDAIAEGYRQLGNVAFLVKQVLAVEVSEHFTSNLIAI